jgi:hypothetical protein
VQLATRADLIQALRGVPGIPESSPRYALLAAQGRALLPRLHAVVNDDAEDGIVRANALWVLAFLLDSSSTGIVLRYATRAGPFQETAYAVLQRFPYPEACERWRQVLEDPPTHERGVDYAISGIRYCGTEADIGVLEAFVARGVTRGTRARVDHAISELRRPQAERYRHTEFAGNYPPTGNYTPPPALAAKIREQLCGGTCPPGLVVQPSAVAALRDR